MCGVPFKKRNESSRGSIAPVSNSKGRWCAIHPVSEGCKLRAQIFPHVEIADARSAAQPLKHAADRKIYAQSAHVDGNRSRRLENIEDHVRADAMGLLDDGARIHDVGAAEQHQRDRHEQRGLVNGGEELVQIERMESVCSETISTRAPWRRCS